MVELLMQSESSSYRTRWQAVNYVNSLKVQCRLSKVWIEGGYYTQVAHIIPPPPRLRRFFTPEEGKVMYRRVLLRSDSINAEHSIASIGGGGGGDGSARDDGGRELLSRFSFPGTIET